MKPLFAALILLSASALASAQAMPADMHHDKPPVPPSSSVTVTVDGKTITLSLADLRAMPQTTVHVHNAHRNLDEDYTGPLASLVLERAGLVASPRTEHMLLHSTVTASATDHYFVVYSAAEIEPMLSHNQVIVAVSKAGAADSEGGGIQLINTTDAKPARWVHGLSSLRVDTRADIN